jgi:hypothetical protein
LKIFWSTIEIGNSPYISTGTIINIKENNKVKYGVMFLENIILKFIILLRI